MFYLMGLPFEPKWPNRNYAIGPMRDTIKSTVGAAEKRFMAYRIPGLDTVLWIFNVKSLNSPFIRVKLPIHSTYLLTSLYASICNEQCMINILTIINLFDYSFA